MNENEVGTPVESSEQGYAPEPEVDVVDSSPEESSSAEPQVVASAEEMSIVIDPVTGERSLQFGNEGEESQDGQQEEQPEEGYEQYQGQPEGGISEGAQYGQQANNAPMYNLEEFSAALASGYVDPSRVPQEYQAQYADYRIREALAQRQAQQRQAYEQEMYQRQQIAMQMTPENRVQANKDFYRGLDEEAKNAALRDLQMTQEQLEEAEYAEGGDEIKKDYDNAVAWHKDRIRNELQSRYQQEQAYKYQQQSIYNSIQNFVATERTREPNFDAIDRRLAVRYRTLPYEQGRVVQAALQALNAGTINPQGVQVIEDYYNACRREFYAQKNGLQATGARQAPRKPPVVESAGSGQQAQRSYKPNYKSLRNADVDQRSAWFAEYFKNNGW